ncbi:hypothetical protein ACFX12_028613 [Malus domestica]
MEFSSWRILVRLGYSWSWDMFLMKTHTCMNEALPVRVPFSHLKHVRVVESPQNRTDVDPVEPLVAAEGNDDGFHRGPKVGSCT